MKLGTPEGTDKAWHLVKIMETDYGDKMVVFLLKIELIQTAEHIDESEYYNGMMSFDRQNFTNQRSAHSNDPNYRSQRHQFQDTDTPCPQVEGPQVRERDQFAEAVY